MSNTTKLILAAVSCLLGGIAIGFNLGGDGGAKQTAISWKYGDAELVIDLEKDLADDETLLNKIFSKQFSAAGATDWLKNKQDLYLYSDPDLADKLTELPFEDPASRALRELRLRRKGPWAYQAQDVRIGIPIREDQPFSSYANVCESGIFFRKKVDIFLPDRPDRKITVNATGRYACPEGYDFPDIQLSREDAKKLFGYDDFSKYEEAAAVVIQE
ncbi:MAG: hypothetical protein AAFZ52_09220 [Bacteroidota bacterium]